MCAWRHISCMAMAGRNGFMELAAVCKGHVMNAHYMQFFISTRHMSTKEPILRCPHSRNLHKTGFHARINCIRVSREQRAPHFTSAVCEDDDLLVHFYGPVDGNPIICRVRVRCDDYWKIVYKESVCVALHCALEATPHKSSLRVCFDGSPLAVQNRVDVQIGFHVICPTHGQRRGRRHG